jgi:hypothetical protein
MLRCEWHDARASVRYIQGVLIMAERRRLGNQSASVIGIPASRGP